MRTTEQEIECALRAVPRSKPPAGLKDQLIAQVRLPVIRTAPKIFEEGGWLRRWWPALAPASVSLACAVGLTVQQMEIRDLKQALRATASEPAATETARPMPAVGAQDASEAAARAQQEIARLKELARQLAAEVAQLEQMRAENMRLRTQLAAPPAGFVTPEEAEVLAKAREEAEANACASNLKQLGLAARMWAVDNSGMSPPNVLAMTDEMSTPKILVCPGDRAREAAKDWAVYTSANCSYEYLAPSAPDTEPERVMFRCPIHGHVALCDASVQGYVARRHPEQLVQQDGKLYFGQPPRPAQGALAPQSGNPPPGGATP
jgi:hypothetical protein